MVKPKLYALEDPPDVKISAPSAVADWFYDKRPFERSVPVIEVRLDITPDDLWYGTNRDLLTEHRVSHGIVMEQTSDRMVLIPQRRMMSSPAWTGWRASCGGSMSSTEPDG